MWKGFKRKVAVGVLAMSLLCSPAVMAGQVEAASSSPVEVQMKTRFQWNGYIVKPGDTLWTIANRNGIGLRELIAANPHLVHPDRIFPYQIVWIPASDLSKPSYPTPSQPSTPSKPSTPDAQIHEYEQQVIDLVNQERAKVGLQPLRYDAQLTKAARAKSADMRDNNYFSHQSPTYGSPFDMMDAFAIQYRSAGENIAAGQRSPQSVMDAWMNSPGHRQNILNSSYTRIGVGWVQGGSYGHYWTQLFAGD